MDLMNTSLDNFTLALFATLRGGGEMINQVRLLVQKFSKIHMGQKPI
jgi:hypothetical protein